MSTASTVRAAVVTALDTALGASWSLYGYPVKGPAEPYAMVQPRSPYRDYATFGQDALHLSVHVGVGLANDTWLDTIDTAVDLVMPALGDVANVLGLSLASVAVTQEGGIVQAIFDISIALPRS